MIRLYLDQCHWSDMARSWASPADVRRLHQLAICGKVQHVLSMAHVVETLQCRQQEVKHLLVKCLNAAPCPLWLKSLDLIICEEVTGYFRDFIGRPTGNHIDPFCDDLFKSIRARKPAIFATSKQRPSIEQLIQYIEDSPPARKRRLLAIGRTEDSPLRSLFHARSVPDAMKALGAFVELYVPRKLPGGKPVSLRLKRAFHVQFDLSRCPALMNLIWIVHHMSRAGMTPDSGDILDLYHAIPAYTYCDVFVTDKRIADFIRRLQNPQGRFAATFKSLSQALRYVEGML